MTCSLRLVYYADDFTGATDALDALVRAGVTTALFIEPPDARDLERVRGCEAIGVAGSSRTLAEADLRNELRSAFGSLAALNAPLCHYKVCSTFDSSAVTGSIGAAIEEGHAAFGGDWIPLLVGVPALGRWCVFGNLFARAGSDGAIARLDRHPVSRHPVTPMHEADLLAHLSLQTDLPSGLVVTHLADDRPAFEKAQALKGSVVRLFDVADLTDLGDAVRAISVASDLGEVRFVVGSSALEYALGARWKRECNSGELPPQAAPTDRVLVLSGSCSPISATQIRRALHGGFADVPLEPAQLEEPLGPRDARDRMLTALTAGRSAVVHSALGPEDPRLAQGRDLHRMLGSTLAALANSAITETQITRIIIVGGDTSSACARALGIRSVDAVATFIPGAPLCRAHAPGCPADGAEVVFKGGSLGREDVLEQAISPHSRTRSLLVPWPHM
jgi:uncharacterized protein YgbK (DUF1537 family)